MVKAKPRSRRKRQGVSYRLDDIIDEYSVLVTPAVNLHSAPKVVIGYDRIVRKYIIDQPRTGYLACPKIQATAGIDDDIVIHFPIVPDLVRDDAFVGYANSGSRLGSVPVEGFVVGVLDKVVPDGGVTALVQVYIHRPIVEDHIPFNQAIIHIGIHDAFAVVLIDSVIPDRCVLAVIPMTGILVTYADRRRPIPICPGWIVRAVRIPNLAVFNQRIIPPYINPHRIHVMNVQVADGRISGRIFKPDALSIRPDHFKVLKRIMIAGDIEQPHPTRSG